MSYQKHPTFAGDFKRVFLRLWCGCVFLMGVSFGAYYLDHPQVGGPLAISWVGVLLAGLGVIFYRIKNVPCPVCGVRMKTRAEKKTATWVAYCAACEKDWDLDVGCEGD